MKKLLLSIPFLFILNSVAFSDVLVIVHPSSSLKSISAKELEQLFLAKAKYLSDGEKAKPVELASEELKAEFYKKFTGKNEVELRKYWAALLFTGQGLPPKQLRTQAEVLEYVKEHSGAIAYIDKSSVDDSVKVLPVTR